MFLVREAIAEVGAVHSQAVGFYCELDRLVQHVASAEHVRMGGLGVEGIVTEAEGSEGFHGVSVRGYS